MPDAAAPPAAAGAAFLDGLRGAFERAARLGAEERTVRIVGRPVRLRIAGEALARRLTPALAHLEAEPTGTPALTVRAWDSAETGVAPPPPPWPADAYRERGAIRHQFDFPAAFNLMSGVLSLLEPGGTEATVWVRDAAALPSWEAAAPLRTLFGWWAPRVGGQLAHGAAVGTDRGGVLLAGRGGSGKSTTALAALDAGLRYAGDDYVVVTTGEAPEVHSLYASAKLVPAHFEAALPHLAARADAPGADPEDKAVLLLHEAFADRLVDRMPLRALLVPHVAHAATPELAPLSARDALQALAPTTVFQLPGADGETLALLSDLVERVPTYALGLSRDLGANVAAIRALIDREADAA